MATSPSTLPPAVAVMAKVPGWGVVKSRLHPSLTPERATDLYRCFLLDRLDAVAALPDVVPIAAFTPSEAEPLMRTLTPDGLQLVSQRGNDLGERLSNLLADLLAAGHTGAIAIDSDSPTLPMAYVSEAASVLARGAADVILGPCEDGGYYLVGLRSVEPTLFRGIPWSTDVVLTLTVARARDLGLCVHRLPPWFDVDTEPDLRRLHREMTRQNDGPPRTYAFVTGLYGQLANRLLPS